MFDCFWPFVRCSRLHVNDDDKIQRRDYTMQRERDANNSFLPSFLYRARSRLYYMPYIYIYICMLRYMPMSLRTRCRIQRNYCVNPNLCHVNRIPRSFGSNSSESDGK